MDLKRIKEGFISSPQPSPQSSPHPLPPLDKPEPTTSKLEPPQLFAPSLTH
jgi:hypothetical protein